MSRLTGRLDDGMSADGVADGVWLGVAVAEVWLGVSEGMWLGVVDLVWLSLRYSWVCLKGCGRRGVAVAGV